MSENNKLQQYDEWGELKSFTNARIALGRTGVSIPLKASLEFKLAHAHARDAVFSELDVDNLQQQLKSLKLKHILVGSKAKDRTSYLQRPDWGRVLDEESQKELKKTAAPACDIAIIISDGLSATAVNNHAVTLINHLLTLFNKNGYTIAPVVLALQARVAISDPIGQLLNARLVLNLIGERPGLSSSDSMGVYITYQPEPGLTDERRNCISNIRPQGLKTEMAAQKIMYLINEAFRLKTSGVMLKDNNEQEQQIDLL